MRLILATSLCIVLTAAAAQGDPQQPAVGRLEPGQAVRCASPNGCVAMDAEVFKRILIEAIHRGQSACGKST